MWFLSHIFRNLLRIVKIPSATSKDQQFIVNKNMIGRSYVATVLFLESLTEVSCKKNAKLFHSNVRSSMTPNRQMTGRFLVIVNSKISLQTSKFKISTFITTRSLTCFPSICLYGHFEALHSQSFCRRRIIYSVLAVRTDQNLISDLRFWHARSGANSVVANNY